MNLYSSILSFTEIVKALDLLSLPCSKAVIVALGAPSPEYPQFADLLTSFQREAKLFSNSSLTSNHLTTLSQ